MFHKTSWSCTTEPAGSMMSNSCGICEETSTWSSSLYQATLARSVEATVPARKPLNRLTLTVLAASCSTYFCRCSSCSPSGSMVPTSQVLPSMVITLPAGMAVPGRTDKILRYEAVPSRLLSSNGSI